jgi:hypothetical protein
VLEKVRLLPENASVMPSIASCRGIACLPLNGACVARQGTAPLVASTACLLTKSAVVLASIAAISSLCADRLSEQPTPAVSEETEEYYKRALMVDPLHGEVGRRRFHSKQSRERKSAGLWDMIPQYVVIIPSGCHCSPI